MSGAGARAWRARFVLLGDFVGYGADPQWTVETVMDLVEHGAVALLGNHDAAIGDPRLRLNAEAQIVVEWTRGELGTLQRQFLANLPLASSDGDRLYVHAEASRPRNWIYVTSTSEAAGSMSATPAQVTFCGHVHQPAVYAKSATGEMTAFTPTTGVAVQLLPRQQWLVVLGAVGQPRDDTPAASYVILDTDRAEVIYCRAPYDIDAAAAQIRKRGLPQRFADRLYLGK